MRQGFSCKLFRPSATQHLLLVLLLLLLLLALLLLLLFVANGLKA